MAKKDNKYRPLPLVAMLLAWLVPGAGHAYIGRLHRGIIIFVVIGATFWAGLAIGGVMTVDYQNERWWFVAEMFAGVHGLVGWHRQQNVYNDLAADYDVGLAPPARTEARAQWDIMVDKKLAGQNIALVAPIDTVARAYAGVAGLLNLLCMFDAVMLCLLGRIGEPKPRLLAKAHGQEAK